MYKIDDIPKLDLSNKKQYAVAKEILDRYILNESEKEGLLEGIKNKGGGSVNDNTEYKYFVLPEDYITLALITVAVEAIGSNFFYYSEGCYAYDMNKTEIHLCSVFDEYLSLQHLRASAIKVDMNKNMIVVDEETNIPKLIKVSNYFNIEDLKYIEITKEEYEGDVKIPKHLICSSDEYVRFVDENNRTKDIEKLFNALLEIHNNNLDINDYYYYIISQFDRHKIVNISEVNNTNIHIDVMDDKYYCIDIENKRIYETE